MTREVAGQLRGQNLLLKEGSRIEAPLCFLVPGLTGNLLEGGGGSYPRGVMQGQIQRGCNSMAIPCFDYTEDERWLGGLPKDPAFTWSLRTRTAIATYLLFGPL